MTVRIAINGFGRVGRSIVRACLGHSDIEIVAVNTRAEAATLVHLLKYDSVHGTIKADVSSKADALIVNGKEIKVTNVTNNLGRSSLESPGRGYRNGVHGKIQKEGSMRSPPVGRRQKSDHRRPRKGNRCHILHGRE